MKTTLIIPDSKMRKMVAARKQSRLRWTTNHSASHYDLGVLLYSTGEILDGLSFRYLRKLLGASIKTSNPDKVCRALGIPVGEQGIVKV